MKEDEKENTHLSRIQVCWWTHHDNFSLFGRQEGIERKIRELRNLAPKLPTVPR